ncbi:MAG: hypothetical protein ABDH20_06345 [Thermus sp.]
MEALLGTLVLGLLYLVDRERERRHREALEEMRRVLEAMGLTLEDLPATVRPVEAAREKEDKEVEK